MPDLPVEAINGFLSGTVELVRVRRCQALRGFPMETVALWIKQGRIPATKIGGRWYTTEVLAAQFVRQISGLPLEDASEPEPVTTHDDEPVTYAGLDDRLSVVAWLNLSA